LATLNSILILGPDAIAAANPATAVQLIHACRRWGFSTVVPASWGDELIASDVIKRCAARDNRPLIQCSCPRVAERLGDNASFLEDSILWLASPPAAVATYLRAVEHGRQIHITYAGGCPGAADASIDQRITAAELILAIRARGIDIEAQPTVFEDVIPADRRRYCSTEGGYPEAHHLWESAAFRVAQPGDDRVGVAQLLLTDERVLIDAAPAAGCVCRTSGDGETTALRAPSPIVAEGLIDLQRAAPVQARPKRVEAPPPEPVIPREPVAQPEVVVPVTSRSSSPRQSYRRQSIWRRSSPRPGMIIARPSGQLAPVVEVAPARRRPEARVIITAIIVATSLVVIGFWFGRQGVPAAGASGAIAPGRSSTPGQLGRSRSP
jgi:hypothetical protein